MTRRVPGRRCAPRAVAALLAALCVLLAGATAPGHAAAQAPTAQELTDAERRLQEIRREREQLRRELEGIRSRVHDLSSEVRNLERQASVSAQLLVELDAQLEQRAGTLERNRRDLQRAQSRLQQRREVLERRLREIHKRGPLHTARVLMGADSFGQLIRRYRYLYLIARQDQRLIDNVGELERRLAVRERLLDRDLRQLESLRGEKAMEADELARLEEQRRLALAAARGRQRSTNERITRLEQDEQRLAGVLAELERRRRASESRAAGGARRAPAAPTLADSDRGRLAWPVTGPLAYRFGRVRQPNGTVLRWNGIGIRAAAGTPVRAVRGGTVVLAGPFEGYGPTVVLSHGGGYYSLYLYLRELRVAEGDVVDAGQEVGTVGGEGTPEGPHVEFQIREPGGAAVDPLPWLQPRSR